MHSLIYNYKYHNLQNIILVIKKQSVEFCYKPQSILHPFIRIENKNFNSGSSRDNSTYSRSLVSSTVESCTYPLNYHNLLSTLDSLFL